MASAMHTAHHAWQTAQAVEAFRRGENVDDLRIPICLSCNAEEQPGKKLLRCSGCKVARYCDKKCATMDWKGTNGNIAECHRDICKDMKEANGRTPEMQAIAEQFPWAKLQSDGTCNFLIFLASKGLLDTGRKAGWWTRPPCCVGTSQYVWGFLLLEDEHLRDDVGWKLPSEQVPWLDFTLGHSAPPICPPPPEHSWSKYYAWRGLPLESPAVMCLHWPLSVFRLLYLLRLASANTLGRRHLTVHLLGVEREVEFLPLFGELALLLPNTDIDLVLFGPGVATILEKAQEKPSCLASRPFAYTYKAPKVSGGATIRIELARCGSFFDGANLDLLRKEKPDAMIALNAGLSTYPEWRSAVLASRALAIPFAVTDYTEISLGSDIRLLLRMFPYWKTVWFPKLKLPTIEQQRISEMASASYPIDLNPFMHPGPRPQNLHAGPNSYNGYTLIVTPGAA
ncbi:hypothetical protein FPV67DRAFT_1563674 [Lyophyllum atratum]|nr:hypothetical protein FPV67DRAFT_1563674 [Lyophyllum atratum]